MTIRELSKYHSLKTEIKEIEENIIELERNVISSSKITGISVSKGNFVGNPTEKFATKLIKIKNKLENKKEELVDELNKIESFLETVEDNEIRIIIRKRFLKGKSWQKIGEEINTDRSTPYYKLKKYLDERGKIK